MLLFIVGSGFIGRAIYERAIGGGREVRSVSRGSRPAGDHVGTVEVSELARYR